MKGRRGGEVVLIWKMSPKCGFVLLRGYWCDANMVAGLPLHLRSKKSITYNGKMKRKVVFRHCIASALLLHYLTLDHTTT